MVDYTELISKMTDEEKAEMRAKEEEALRAINLSEEYFDHPTGEH